MAGTDSFPGYRRRGRDGAVYSLWVALYLARGCHPGGKASSSEDPGASKAYGMNHELSAQQRAILLRLVEKPEKWWKRSELRGTKNMRLDLERLAHPLGYIETMERKETLGSGLKVTVTLYRLAPPYRSLERIKIEVGV